MSDSLAQPSPPSYAAAVQFMGDQRAYPNGIDLAALRLAYAERIAHALPEPTSPDTGWRSIGPTNVAGRVLALAMVQDRPHDLWVGTATSGLWKFIDSGSSYRWVPIETGFPTQSVSSIYIDSAFHDLIFIGTGEVYGFGYFRQGRPGTDVRTLRGFYGSGIYRSLNNGKSWENVLSFPDSSVTAVNRIVANPRFTRSMYAATSEGIYKSYDQGNSWELKSPVKMAMDIVISRVDTTRLFAACGDQGTQDPGIYRSTDAGEHWSKVNVVPTAFTGRSALAISATDPKFVYAGISDRFGAQGFFRSTDGGDTWHVQNDTDYTQFQGWYTNVVEVNPYFFDEVFAGGIALWKSTQSGKNMVRIEPQDHYHVDIHALLYDRSDVSLSTIFIGTDGGLFRSTDLGLTFSDLNNGFVSAQFYDGLANAVSDSMLAIGGLQDNGTWKYTGTTTWKSILGGDGSWCGISPTAPNVMLAQYAYINPANPTRSGLQLFRSVNSGAGFAQVLFDTSDNVSFTSPLVTARDGKTLYCGTSRVWKSTNIGATWQNPSQSQLDSFVAGSNSCIALAVSRSTPDTLYAATAPITHQAGVFASFDGGITWRSANAGLPNGYPTHLAIDARDSRIAYITYSGFNLGHVWRTTNAGISWNSIASNLPSIPTNVILPDPLDRGILYVGNDLGVYSSTDTGTTWQLFSNGLPPAIVTAITMVESTRTLRIATHGRGAFERSAIQSRVKVENKHEPDIAAVAIYPSVVTRGGDVTIVDNNGRILSRGDVVVCDIAGRIVQHLKLAAHSVSPNNFTFSTAALSPGTYFIATRGTPRRLLGSIVIIK